MAGTITRSAHPSLLWPGVNKVFGNAYNEHPLQYTQVYDIKKSGKHYEEDVESTGLGLAPVKPAGEAITYDSLQEGFTSKYVHVTYGLGYIITEEAIEDNQYEPKSFSGAARLARSMRQTKEIVHAQHFNRAFDATNPGGDGVAMISDAHPVLAGTQSNKLTVAADLSEASIEQMLIQMKDMRDSRGLKIHCNALKLIVADANIFNAERIMKTNLRVGTDLNDINAIKSMGLLPQGVMPWTYLTDPDAWFLKTDVPDGVKSFNRRALKFKQDNDFDTANAKAKATERYACGHSDWRAIYGSEGS